MYLFSFLKSLFKPRNILSTIYFLLNAAMVFLAFAFLPFKISSDGTLNFVYLGLIGLGVNLVIILISLSPLGEYFWRIRNGVVAAPPQAYAQAWNVALQAFDEVRQSARLYTKSVSDKVKLYYMNANDINAFALGHRTVIVTAGLLCSVNYEAFKGVLAHEMGHIAHGDSDLKLGITVSNGILVIFMTVISVIANFFIGMFDPQNGGLLGIIGIILHIIFNIILIGIFKLWTLLGVLLINATSRKCEFAADKFGKDIGYGEGLQAFLSALSGNEPKTSWFNLMFQTHPDTPDRLERLAAA